MLRKICNSIYTKYNIIHNCEINAQTASLRSLVAAESTLHQPMQPARDHLLFLCGFWMCISIVDWNESVPQFLGVWLWPFTFRGHLRSKIFSPFESPCMTSYLTSIDTFSLSHTVFEILDFKVFRVWPWPSEVTWSQEYFHHSKAHTWLHLTSIDTFSLSRTVFEIFDFNYADGNPTSIQQSNISGLTGILLNNILTLF